MRIRCGRRKYAASRMGLPLPVRKWTSNGTAFGRQQQTSNREQLGHPLSTVCSVPTECAHKHLAGTTGTPTICRLPRPSEQPGHPLSGQTTGTPTNNRDTHYLPRCPGHEIGHQQSVEAGSSHGRLVGIYASRRAKSHDLTDRTDDFQPPSTPHPRRTRFDVMR